VARYERSKVAKVRAGKKTKGVCPWMEGNETRACVVNGYTVGPRAVERSEESLETTFAVLRLY
jgi:hypothetical protein